MCWCVVSQVGVVLPWERADWGEGLFESHHEGTVCGLFVVLKPSSAAVGLRM